MSVRSPLKYIGIGKEDNIRPKIASAVKEIELHRRELENLRSKLEQRRRTLFETTIRAMMSKDKPKAAVYANEWSELRKVGRVVYASELALTQVMLRLESIVDVGDVMSHMSTAFKVLRQVNKAVVGVVPSLDQASDEFNAALTETMAEMGNVSPSISLNIQTDSGEELVEQARKLAEQRADEMKSSMLTSPRQIELEAKDIEKKIPLLADGELDDEEAAILGTLYKQRPVEDAEGEVLRYASIHNGNVDITDASAALKMPSDDIEQAMLKLLSEGKVKISDGGSKS